MVKDLGCCELWCRSQTTARILRYCGVGVGIAMAVAPFRPLSREPSYAVGAALKSKNKKQKTGFESQLCHWPAKKG